MSANVRLLLFFLPLLAFALWGTSYKPGILFSDDSTDISLATMPPLPDWAKSPLPDFTVINDTTEKKAAFFSFLYPRIVLANSRILIQRQYLFDLEKKDNLSEKEKHWLEQQASRLRVDAPVGSDEMYGQLAEKLDIIPPSLILAQAANESAWGTSRFAVDGNNLFGQWCFSRGCGLVPANRTAGANHEVAHFDSPYLSVRSYIQNLNRHRTYRPLRSIRKQSRSSDDQPQGTSLAGGLMGYSERGKDYIEEIRSMIRFNKLSSYDQHFNETVSRHSDSATLVEVATAPAQNLLPGQSGEG